LPESLVKEEAQTIINRQFKEADWNRLRLNSVNRLKSSPEAGRKKSQKSSGLRKIIEQEGLKVTEEEYEEI
jgi:DNA polymerase III delta prime subunit